MDFDNFTKPMLTEPGVKYFLSQTLKQCHEIREKYHNFIFNLMLFVSFFSLLGILLLYKYKGKLSDTERAEKDRIKQQYLLQKLRNLQEAKKRESQQLITGLPAWDSEYDIIHNKFKY